MSGNYIPLYRKYRPQTLDMLVGQEHIKKTLTNAIELGKISHAYLFTGPRGTGKTSTARILAKSLNCINGPTIHPCGECASCKDITNSVPIDVIEIDAASNRKVEDAQNILEKVQYVPVNGKYKIYIIDEVHMLTNHAFNALLKTLEEPPENVIFILATTEVHKVLDTIKSRCQRFDFRRITTEDIVKHLRYIADKEKINISDDALFSIAKNSAGGMRDSISLLDQLSLLGISKQIEVEDVNAILGRISFDILKNLTDKIISSSPSEAIEILNDIYNSGNEPLQILTNLSEYFKNLLITKTCSKELLGELTGLNEPQIAELEVQKESLETHQIVFLIERTSYYIKEVKLASNQHLWLEVGIIDLANMNENSTLLDLQKRVSALEGSVTVGTASGMIQAASSEVQKPAPASNYSTEPKTFEPSAKKPAYEEKKVENKDIFTPPPMSKKLDMNSTEVLWQNLLSNINSPSTQALLKLATPIKLAPDGIVLTIKNPKLVDQINDTNKKQLIIEAGNKLFNQEQTSVTVRTPQSGDVQQVSSAVPPAEKTPDVPALPEQSEPIKEEAASKMPEPESESVQDEPEKPEQNNSETVKRSESDQEKMVISLFDGKYVQ